MQIKKRAKSVKFGGKAKPVEEKKEEQKETPIVNEQVHVIIQPVEQNQQPQVPVEEETKVKEENKENVTSEVVDNGAVAAVIEKNSDQINQEEAQVREDVAAPITQKQEVVSEPTVNLAEKPISPVSEEVVNDSAYIVQTEVKKNMLRYFIIIAVVSFFIGLVSMAGISLFLQKTPFALPFIQRKAAEVTPSPKPTITVEPTKIIEVNPAEYSIEVLNGSEITGAASKLKTALTTDGFNVISAGNADKSDYTDTVISAKKKVSKAFLEKLKENLKKTYTLALDAKTSVPETSEADVIITIGSNSVQN